MLTAAAGQSKKNRITGRRNNTNVVSHIYLEICIQQRGVRTLAQIYTTLRVLCTVYTKTDNNGQCNYSIEMYVPHLHTSIRQVRKQLTYFLVGTRQPRSQRGTSWPARLQCRLSLPSEPACLS